MKTEIVIYWVLLIIVGSIVTTAVNRSVDKKQLSFEFNGIVDDISYNVKETPTLSINGREYILNNSNWNFNKQIEAGDSLIKKKNDWPIILIKNNTGKRIIFTHK